MRDYDLSSLRGDLFGGAPTPPETIDKAREVLPIEPSFANAYGLTETHGVATVNGGKDLLGRKTSIGRPLPMLDLKIVDEDGKELPDGQLGELRSAAPTITPGYWNRPDATARDRARRLALHRRPRLPRRARASTSSSTAPRT